MDTSAEDLLLLRAKARILFSLICLLWGIHALNAAVFQGGLNRVFGIRPRELWGLIGVFTAHLLHDEDDHLPNNTLALVPLGGFVILQGIPIFYTVTIVTALVAGIGTWLLGAPAPAHDAYKGASGVIFGYLGFLLIYGLTSGNSLAFLFAVITGFCYGRSIIGSKQLPSQILPGSRGAWITHLFGFVGGIIAAYLLSYAHSKG